MKKLYYLLVISSVFLVSCTNCTWVQTGYHYDWDGDYVEEGYYDCPEENPVSYEIIIAPELDVEFKKKVYGTFKENYHKLEFTISNIGSANALNVNVLIKIYRTYIPGLGEKKIEFERKIELIKTYINETIEYSFRDIAISGFGVYNVSITIEFKDVKGKIYKVNKYFEI